MSDFRTFHGGEARAPTWAERDRIEALRERGIEDVYVEAAEAPQEFWESVMVTIDRFLMPSEARALVDTWRSWEREMIYASGWRLHLAPKETFENLVREGMLFTTEGDYRATPGQRFAAIEHFLDLTQGNAQFEERVNDRARWFRVGVRLEDRRFTPITSEYLHAEVVRPALLLLAQERFAEVDGLYRKAFDRVLSGDPSGAITASISAVEEMFRALMPSMKNQTLAPLAEKARADGVIAPAVEEFVKKLYALRPDSDAHAGGTSDFDLAMLAVHLAGSILLYLSKTES
jgi:hypothetical protein